MILNDVSAGEEQRHVVENAFNVLVNEGFLREQQGVHTLEVVQKFHEIINEPIGRATMAKKDLMDFCGRHFLPYYGVITLVKIDSTTNDKNFHAVRLSNFRSFFLQSVDIRYTVALKETDFISNELILTTIDSGAPTGRTVVKVPLSKKGELQLGAKGDQWCLGNRYCYFLFL